MHASFQLSKSLAEYPPDNLFIKSFLDKLSLLSGPISKDQWKRSLLTQIITIQQHPVLKNQIFSSLMTIPIFGHRKTYFVKNQFLKSIENGFGALQILIWVVRLEVGALGFSRVRINA